MKRMAAFLVLVLLGSIGLIGCGGGGGTAQAQVTGPGGGSFTIPGAPRKIDGIPFLVKGFDMTGCNVDGDIQVVNNVVIFSITGGPTEGCISLTGVEVIIPTPTVNPFHFHSR